MIRMLKKFIAKATEVKNRVVDFVASKVAKLRGKKSKVDKLVARDRRLYEEHVASNGTLINMDNAFTIVADFVSEETVQYFCDMKEAIDDVIDDVRPLNREGRRKLEKTMRGYIHRWSMDNGAELADLCETDEHGLLKLWIVRHVSGLLRVYFAEEYAKALRAEDKIRQKSPELFVNRAVGYE